jgi:hypothetical protein
MAFLTDAFITATLARDGAAEYDALAPSAATKAQLIALADSVVEAAAIKGGYSTVSAASPPSGSALLLLQQMAFVVWLRIAYRGAQITLADDIVPDWPRPFWLYAAQNDEKRLDLPGLTRDSLNAPDGARISNGYDADGVTAATPTFTLASMARFT